MIIIRVEEIITMIRRDREVFDNDIQTYKQEMDSCIPFGKEYWLKHDKYLAAFIKYSYLGDLLKRIGV